MSALGPHAMLAELQRQGVRLSVRDGRIHGPKKMTQAQRKCVADNKVGLLIALTYVCPTCNQSVRMYDRGSYWSLECALDPVHYSEVLTKKQGAGLGYVSKHDADCPCQLPEGAAEDLGW